MARTTVPKGRQAMGSGKSSRTTRAIYAAAVLVAIAAVLVWGLGGPGEGWFGLGSDPEGAGHETTSDGRDVGGDTTTRTVSVDPTGTSGGEGNTDGTDSSVTDEDAGATGDPDTDATSDEISQGAVGQIDIPGFDVPETYEVDLEVLGWASRASGTVYVELQEARLMGPIDPVTGVESGPPPSDAVDQSVRFEGLVVLATTSEGVQDSLVAGSALTVRLVLVPWGEGAAFRIDRLAD